MYGNKIKEYNSALMISGLRPQTAYSGLVVGLSKSKTDVNYG